MRYLREDGKIVIVSTLDGEYSWFRKWVKPKMRWFCGDMCDFGGVTLKSEMECFCRCQYFKNVEWSVVNDKVIRFWGRCTTYMVKIYP